MQAPLAFHWCLRVHLAGGNLESCGARCGIQILHSLGEKLGVEDPPLYGNVPGLGFMVSVSPSLLLILMWAFSVTWCVGVIQQVSGFLSERTAPNVSVHSCIWGRMLLSHLLCRHLDSSPCLIQMVVKCSTPWAALQVHGSIRSSLKHYVLEFSQILSAQSVLSVLVNFSVS